MNISFYDFKNLDHKDQCNLVIHNGKIMTERISENVKFILYEFSNFSVEIIYNISSEKTSVINVFQNKAAYAV
ncbi:hypothetical protein [Chryseobacterium sp.]|uniref:hypothetical protein n=1 Tax=Chryseobacterium sp. TaxID=1871047 RepID=UPI00289F24BE|nr:hypothetical protein [Chryseobacterium sp.]